MSKKKRSQQEDNQDFLEQMDHFAHWMEKHSKTLMMVFLGFAFVVAAFWSYSAMQNRSLNKAANAAGLLNRKIDLLEKAIANTKEKENPEYKKNLESEVSKLQDEVKKLNNSYPLAATTMFTTVRWASFLDQEQKQPEKALEALSLNQVNSNQELAATLLLLKASLLQKSNEEAKAITVYNDILSNEAWSVFHSEALIKKALLLDKEGKRDEAISLLTKARDKASGSNFSKDAEKYLRLLEVKKNHREIFDNGNNNEG